MASELAVYSDFVSVGSYLVVMDTVIKDLPADAFEDRPWDAENNPWTAVSAFLRSDDRYLAGRSERPTSCNCGAGRLLTPSALKIVTRQGTMAIIWGGTGHAKVVHQLLKSLGITTSGICDRNRDSLDSDTKRADLSHRETISRLAADDGQRRLVFRGCGRWIARREPARRSWISQ